MSNNPPIPSGASLNNIEDKLDTELRRLQTHTVYSGYQIDHSDQTQYRQQAHSAINQLIKDAYQEGVKSVVTLEQLERNREREKD